MVEAALNSGRLTHPNDQNIRFRISDDVAKGGLPGTAIAPPKSSRIVDIG
jgi:hypothetical protein